jgi:hypothetical protein
MLVQGIPDRLFVLTAHLGDDVCDTVRVTADRRPHKGLVQAVFLESELAEQPIETLLSCRMRLQLLPDAIPMVASFAARLQV